MHPVVTTKKRAAAFRATDGEIIYVLFRIRSDGRPLQNLHWSAISVGDLWCTLRNIFKKASKCETEGTITPERYIADWMKELAAPLPMPDVQFEIQVGHGDYASICADSACAVYASLTDAGLIDLRDKLMTGKAVSLSLYQDVKATMAIYSNGSLDPWKALRVDPINGHRNALLGYAPTPEKHITPCQPVALKWKVDCPTVRGWIVEMNGWLLQLEDGSWHSALTESHFVRDYVASLWVSEPSEPGGYRKLIKAYREALAAAPALPLGTKVVVDATMQMEDDDRRYLRNFTTKFPVTSTARGFEVDVTPDNAYDLMNMRPLNIMTWVFPENLAQLIASAQIPKHPGLADLIRSWTSSLLRRIRTIRWREAQDWQAPDGQTVRPLRIG